MSFDSVRQILDDHAYDSLIGMSEDTWLEAKGNNPYDFSTPTGRYELAKDVAAFANNAGGVIIVGLTTVPAAGAQTDEITAFDLCTSASFTPHQYQSIIAEYIHPAIDGLDISWHPVSVDGTAGLGVIVVPPQNPDRQYFLIAKVVEAGTKLKEIVFGVVRRNDAANDSLTRAQLYRHMQDGKSTLAQKLDRMNEKLDALMVNSQHPLEEIDPELQYAARAAEILDENQQ
jgi:predicted HTH transcriptional regulator